MKCHECVRIVLHVSRVLASHNHDFMNISSIRQSKRRCSKPWTLHCIWWEINNIDSSLWNDAVLHNQVKIFRAQREREKATELTFLYFSLTRVPFQHIWRFCWWRKLSERLGMTYLTDHISFSVSKKGVPLRETRQRQCAVKSRVIQRQITLKGKGNKGRWNKETGLFPIIN